MRRCHIIALGWPPAELADVAPVSRADLSADIAAFVPDDVPVDRLINFRTTGTTGHPLPVPSHPIVAARYLCFHKRALARFGVVAQAGAGAVGVILLGHQRRCFTYASVTSSMEGSRAGEINLHPDDWADPADCARYLDAMAPEIVAGDPISFTTLLDPPVTLKPRALQGAAIHLRPARRAGMTRVERPIAATPRPAVFERPSDRSGRPVQFGVSAESFMGPSGGVQRHHSSQ